VLSLAKEILTALIVKVDIVELWGRSATTKKKLSERKTACRRNGKSKYKQSDTGI